MSDKKSLSEIVTPFLGKLIGGLIIAVLGKLKGKTSADDDEKALEEWIEKEVKK